MVKLREFREQLGFSQEVMARKINATLSYYSQIERGHVPAGKGFMRKMKKTYPEINIDEVFFSDLSQEVF